MRSRRCRTSACCRHSAERETLLFPRHCDRSEAIQLSSRGEMDCFAVLAMTALEISDRRMGRAQRNPSAACEYRWVSLRSTHPTCCIFKQSAAGWISKIEVIVDLPYKSSTVLRLRYETKIVAVVINNLDGAQIATWHRWQICAATMEHYRETTVRLRLRG